MKVFEIKYMKSNSVVGGVVEVHAKNRFEAEEKFKASYPEACPIWVVESEAYVKLPEKEVYTLLEMLQNFIEKLKGL